MKQSHYLDSIYRGKVAHRYGVETAIDKSPIETSLTLSYEGLDGDQCAEQKHHGGPDRALHHYPIEHYAFWQKKYGSAQDWKPAGMGENLSTEGMTEDTVCVGDRFQWGEAVIEVSQPRSPCYKLNKRWGITNFSQQVQDTGRCGWLYRVIKSGMVSVKEPLQLIEQDANGMTLREICDVFFGDPLNKVGLLKLKQQDKLSASWMTKVDLRIETSRVENWNSRLLGYDNTVKPES